MCDHTEIETCIRAGTFDQRIAHETFGRTRIHRHFKTV